MKHDLKQRYFHGCQDCRDCCNGKLFSTGEVKISDFKKIIRLFPTAIDIETHKMIFFYSLLPQLGCHYFRDNNCSLYNITDRPDTCLNYPFGFDNTHTLQYDPEHCPNLNKDDGAFPTILENGDVNPKVLNEFFTEHQYNSIMTNADNILKEFVELVIDSECLFDFPTFKTPNGDVVNINEFEGNKKMKIIDSTKLHKILEKQQLTMYNTFVEGHLLSLENLPQFGKRMLEII